MFRPDLVGWRMQYDRMRRSYDLVMTPHQSSVDYQHHLFHYIQDCWHLKDWLKNDPVSGLGEDIEGLVGRRRSLQIVAGLANAAKHLQRDRSNRLGAYVVSEDVTVHLAQDLLTDIVHTIELADGSRVTGEEIVRDSLRDWDLLLRERGLLA